MKKACVKDMLILEQCSIVLFYETFCGKKAINKVARTGNTYYLRQCLHRAVYSTNFTTLVTLWATLQQKCGDRRVIYSTYLNTFPSCLVG